MSVRLKPPGKARAVAKLRSVLRPAGESTPRWTEARGSGGADPLRTELGQQLLRRLVEARSGLGVRSDPGRCHPSQSHPSRCDLAHGAAEGLAQRLAPELRRLSDWRNAPRGVVGVASDQAAKPSSNLDGGLQRSLESLRQRRYRGALDVLREVAWRQALLRTEGAEAAWLPAPGLSVPVPTPAVRKAAVSDAGSELRTDDVPEAGQRAAADPLERAAWKVLEGEAREGREVPHRPPLGEEPSETLARLSAVDAVGGAGALWRARGLWLSGERRAALRTLEAEVGDAHERGGSVGGESSGEVGSEAGKDPHSIRQAVQWRLESGSPGRAVDVLERAGAALHAAPDLSLWMAICLALLGRTQEAEEWCERIAPQAFPWESARARLWREQCPWARAWWPAGPRAASATPRPVPASGGVDLEGLRQRWGVACVAVLAWSGAGELECWGSAPAQNLRRAWESWLAELQLDGPHGGEDQRRALRESRCLRWHAEGGESLTRGAIGAKAMLAFPVRDDRGEPVAVLHVECEHHLLPTDEELEVEARRWAIVHWARRTAALGSRTELQPASRPDTGSEAVLETAGAGRADEVDPETADWVRRAVERLPFKLGRRRWAWLDGPANGAEPSWTLVATSPDAAHLAPGQRLAVRSLERAARWGTSVGWRADREHLGLWPDTRCGRVWPVTSGGRTVALLALESARVDDLDEGLERRVREALEHLGAGWNFQCFARHLRRLRRPVPDPWFLFDVDPAAGQSTLFESLAVARRMNEWAALSESPGPMLMIGEPGVGARTVASWMGWASARSSGASGSAPTEWIEPTLGWGPDTDAAVRELVHQLEDRFGIRRGVVSEVGGSGAWERGLRGNGAVRSSALGAGAGSHSPIPRARLRLRSWSEARDAAPHPDAARAVEAAARLWPGPALALRPLRARRVQLGGLARQLWTRSSDEVAPLGGETLQRLWRQPWPTQAAGLGAFLRACQSQVRELRFDPQDPCELPLEVMRREFRRLGWQWLDKVPARHPKGSWLTAAVASTRLANGRVNARAAAGLLGWDRQTFARRWRELEARTKSSEQPCAGSGRRRRTAG